MNGFSISKIILGIQQNTALFLQKLKPGEQQQRSVESFNQNLNPNNNVTGNNSQGTGVNQGVNTGINQGTNQVVNQGTNQGVNTGVNQGVNTGVNQGNIVNQNLTPQNNVNNNVLNNNAQSANAQTTTNSSGMNNLNQVFNLQETPNTIVNNQQPTVQNQNPTNVVNNQQPVVQSQNPINVVNNQQQIVQNQNSANIANTRQPVIQNQNQANVVNNQTANQQTNTANQVLRETISQQLNNKPVNSEIKPAQVNTEEVNLPQVRQSLDGNKQQQGQVQQNNRVGDDFNNIMRMNVMQATDRSVFVKNLLGLPQDLGRLFQAIQNPNKPLTGGTLGLANLNQEIIQNRQVLASLFEDMNVLPVNPQEVLLNPAIQAQNNAQIKQDAVLLLFSGMISLPDISRLILDNGKHAVANLILAMASASKYGINSEQIQDTLKIINSCIAMAESDNPAQNLKSLMMLYLPWLPLNDGVGFDLEITPPDGENDSNDSKLTVLIQTKNYGNIKGVFTLTTSNSVDVYIICSESFPKKILQQNLMEESTAHAMNTNIDIEEVQPLSEESHETNETKVNLSATNEMNPYLLLMAHSFIRNTILIDNNY